MRMPTEVNLSATAKSRLAASAVGILLLVNAAAAPEPEIAKVDKLFAQWERQDSPGAAIVVVKDGAVVYEHGYGYANLEHRIPITPQTRFDVASVAKQFTGLSVAMLVERGKLSLDDDVRKYLPDVPDLGNQSALGICFITRADCVIGRKPLCFRTWISKRQLVLR